MTNGRPLNVNTGSTENAGFELLAFYVPMRHLRLDANYSFLHTSRTLTAAPKHKLFMGADWQPGLFTLHSGLQWIDGLHTADNSPATENFWLWDLTASLRISRALKFFVHGRIYLPSTMRSTPASPCRVPQSWQVLKCNCRCVLFWCHSSELF